MARPTDPIEVLRWVQSRRNELDRIERVALFNSRLQGSFEEALTITGLSRKKAVAATRAENASRGRMIRWNGS